jgi:catechol 2,3-dioxygenase-like lactoylglutathione lyase family enzyme
VDAKLRREIRLLKAYSLISVLIFCVLIFVAARGAGEKAKFEEMDVQRINIVEPDGTLRMVLSNKALFPGIIIKGKETPHPNRKTAGMLFFNDEATENGGLIFGGMKDKSGSASSYGHLSFDQYEQDQIFTIDAQQEGKKRKVGLAVIDRPDYPIGELIAFADRVKGLPEDQQKAEYAKFQQTHPPAASRLYLGRADDGSVGLKLKDAGGLDRIVIEVAADGSPAVRFLDPKGNVIYKLPADPAPGKGR